MIRTGPCRPRDLLAYSLFALPLTMMALPVYVLVPPFYATTTGLALSTIGAVLLATRVLDAFVDPLLGAWVDRSRGVYLRPLLIAAPVLAAGYVLLFSPLEDMSPGGAAAWLTLTLIAATLGYSLATIAYQAWGARLADDDSGRARVTAWREGFGLVGVILASLLSTWGPHALIALFLGTLAIALVALVKRAPRRARRRTSPRESRRGAPSSRRCPSAASGGCSRSSWPTGSRPPCRRRSCCSSSPTGCRWSSSPGCCSRCTSSRRPAACRCGHGSRTAGACTRPGSPAWRSRSARSPGRTSSARATSSPSRWSARCPASALGADLALPPALLARVIGRSGHSGAHEGAYFGLWNFANKMNLALAAGLALPVLEALGYAPGARDATALDALAFAYAVLPCLLKLVAAALLLVAWRGQRC